MLPGRAVAQAQGDTCMVSDVLCYEDLLDEAPLRVETDG